MQKLTAEQWSEYWKNNTITTFHNIFKDNYDGNIKEYWHSIFELLTDESLVIDFATGNGAIANLAATFSQAHNKNFKVIGIDYAKINPTSEIDNLIFMGETPIENTGIENETAALVTSQYGLEYSNIKASVDEAYRILNKKGILALMTHRVDSVLLQEAFQAKQQMDLCRKTHLVKISSELHREIKNPGKKSEKLRLKFNNQLALLYEKAKLFRDPNYIHLFSRTLTNIFSDDNKILTTGEKNNILSALKVETNHYQQRMDDLIAAALDAKKLKEMIEHIKSAGFQLKTSAPMLYKNQLFGHCIVAIK